MYERLFASFNYQHLVRRHFLKLVTAFAGMWAFFRSIHAYGILDDSGSGGDSGASGGGGGGVQGGSGTSGGQTCTPAKLLTKWQNLLQADEPVLVWTDGMHNSNKSAKRANLAVLIQHEQSTAAYINIVYLVVQSGNEVISLGFRYFDAYDRMSNKGLPYIIFNNVNLTGSGTYSIIYSVRTAQQDIGYIYTLTDTDLDRTRVNNPLIFGATINQDIYAATNRGTISTLIEYSDFIKFEDLNQFQVRCRFIQYDRSDIFALQVDFIKPDVLIDPICYNRYFFVTDPVGRILAVKRRSGPSNKEDKVLLTPLTESERVTWKITPDQVARLSDCPYVMVFAEYYSVSAAGRGLGRTIVYLR